MRKYIQIASRTTSLLMKPGGFNQIARRLRTMALERYYGIETNKVVYLSELALDHAERREYAPVDFNDFDTLLARLTVTKEQNIFIDFGSGMGRALVLAARAPFKKVIGIELSDDLNDIARKNISRAMPRLRCRNIEVVSIDATEAEFPNDPTVMFFNNPFSGEILDRVLQNIRRSHSLNPRSITIVCNLPAKSAFYEQISKVEWLDHKESMTLSQGARIGLIYEVKQRGRGLAA